MSELLYNIIKGVFISDQNSPSFWKRISINFGNFLLFAAIVYLIFLIGQTIWKNYQTEKVINNLQTVVEMKEIENVMNQELLAYYQSDSFREVELRRRLILKKAGEHVVLLPIRINPTPKIQSFSEQAIAPPEDKPPNYRLWWQLFFSPKPKNS